MIFSSTPLSFHFPLLLFSSPLHPYPILRAPVRRHELLQLDRPTKETAQLLNLWSLFQVQPLRNCATIQPLVAILCLSKIGMSHATVQLFNICLLSPLHLHTQMCSNKPKPDQNDLGQGKLLLRTPEPGEKKPSNAKFAQPAGGLVSAESMVPAAGPHPQSGWQGNNKWL